MSDLIERVARAAGWETYHPYVGITLKGDMTLAAEGLVFLLRELLAAGYAVIGTYRVERIVPFGEAENSFEADTLEEAVMMAFLHKGER